MKNIKTAMKKLDWKALEDYASGLTGLNIRFKVGVDSRGHLEIQSQDIVEHAGVMRLNFQSLRLENFGGGLNEDGEVFWVPICFSYTHKSGGTNGCDFFDAQWVFEKNRWEFK